MDIVWIGFHSGKCIFVAHNSDLSHIILEACRDTFGRGTLTGVGDAMNSKIQLLIRQYNLGTDIAVVTLMDGKRADIEGCACI